jgi:mono/diheme cytochrome c family protein
MPPALAVAALLAAQSAEFDTHVRPVLASRCVGCHGPQKQRGGLRLDRRADALRGGDSGAAVLPGDPAASPLLARVSSPDPAERMPPTGDPLTSAEVAAVRRWIAAGAVWPADAGPRAADHWAFRPVVRPPVPEIRNPNSGTRNPIDAFIVRRLSAEGLAPSPEADRRTLIRRLTFDLHGLPPTPEDVAAFEQDPSPDAYEKLVDRLLAAPQYGERWARHWLDVVRFAESHGFEMNQPRPAAWPYRDWVIRSLNEDKPYDRFVFEQLAGDAVGADAATGFLVAGPWDQVKSPDPVLTAQQRADELHDLVSATGATFLGLTVGCARCHAHKFDPIPQADYYRIAAVFAGVQHGEREVRPADPGAKARAITAARAKLAGLEAKLAAFEPLADPAAIAPRRSPVNPRVNVERFPPVTARFVRFVAFATNQYEPCLDELEVFTAGPEPRNVALATAGAKASSAGDYPSGGDIHKLEHLTDGRYGNGRSWISDTVGRGRVTVAFAAPARIDRVVWGRDREGKFADRLATRYRIDVSADGENWQVVASSDDRLPEGSPATAAPPGLSAVGRVIWAKLTAGAAAARAELAGLARADVVYAGRFTAPEPTRRLHRGDPTAPREPVAPGGLSEVGPPLLLPADAPEQARRVALARWLTDPRNPLPARVIANRLWQGHFGTGLVDTPSDFGKNGGTPSHPELLDWLAAELVEGGWSLKHLHRLIVTSATYRQSSGMRNGTPAASVLGFQIPQSAIRNPQSVDAANRLLWRYPPRRREAEAIRDAVLFVSGDLDPTPGGPGFDLFEPNTNYVKVYTPKATFGRAEFRRMVYQQRPRMQPDDTFGAFDCPDGGRAAPRRPASTTPLQALNLLNAPFLVQQAGSLAARATKEAGPDPAAAVRRVFRLAFQREPSAGELTAAVGLAKAHGLPAVGRAVLNANEFLYLD